MSSELETLKVELEQVRAELAECRREFANYRSTIVAMPEMSREIDELKAKLEQYVAETKIARQYLSEAINGSVRGFHGNAETDMRLAVVVLDRILKGESE